MYMLCVSGWGKKENMLVMLFLSRKKKENRSCDTKPSFLWSGCVEKKTSFALCLVIQFYLNDC